MAPGTTRTSPTDADQQPVTWVAMLNRTLCIAMAVVVAAALVATATALATDAETRGDLRLWVLAVSQAALIAAFLRQSSRSPKPADAVVTMVLAAVGLTAACSLTWPDRPAVSSGTVRLLPLQALQVQFVAAAFLFRRFRWVIVTMAITAAGTIWLTRNSTGDVIHGVGWLPTVSFGLSAVVLIRALREAAWEATRLAERRREMRAGVVASCSAQLADDEGRRAVHDGVLGALASVEAGADPATVSAACQAALTALSTFDPTPSASSMREALLAHVRPHVRVNGSGWHLVPPPQVVTALRESAGEAIRNVGRHAGVDEVSVTLTTTRSGQASVVVRDSGRGFDPGGRPGFGLSESIVARMGQVGGEARIESSPGMGTTVRLLWPHLSGPRALPSSGVLAPGGRSGLYVRVMLPVVVGMLGVALVRAPGWSNPPLAVALAVLLSAVMLACANHVGRTRPTWPVIVAIACFNAAITVATLSLAPDRALLSLDAWVVTGCAVAIGSVSLEASLAQVTFLAFAEVAAISGLVFADPRVGLAEPAGALIMPVACGAMSFAVGSLLRRGSTMLAVQEAVFNAEMDEVGWVESAQAARKYYSEQLEANVAPFLGYCAAQKPPSSEQLRTRAAALAAQCRDLLAMSEAMPAPAREAVLQARKQGVRVAIRDAPSVSPVAWTLLATVLKHFPGADAVTLIPARRGSPARVTGIPRIPSQAQADIRAELDGQRILIEHTEVTTSFVLVSPEWGTSVDAEHDLGSTT